MGNLMDYLDWRGDLPFQADGFNEVDSLILTQLIYVDFGGIAEGPESGAAVSLKEASARFWNTHTEEEILAKVSMTKSAPFVMRRMAETKRFGEIALSRYVNEISEEEQSQFSVACMRLPGAGLYVAFCGTDDTIVGWRENFNMGYLAETPGQRKAVEYLSRVLAQEQEKVRVGGHSKGGNLAVYASVKCELQLQEKIAAVYSNDGPGFSREVIESESYRRILPKIRTILPESSIVGLLLEHQGACEVVKSSQNGVMQHDALSWEVLGARFIRTAHVAAESVLLDETMKSWIYQLSGDEREQIVETIFSMLEDAGIKTVDDFYGSPWKMMQELLKARSRLSGESQKLLSRALKLLWNEGNRALRRAVKERKQGSEG